MALFRTHRSSYDVRGFLTSQLVKLQLSDWQVYLIVGCVWGAWRIPYYLVFLPDADMEPVLPVGRVMFAIVTFVTMVCWSVMFIELYRVTQSIWPCVILHMTSGFARESADHFRIYPYCRREENRYFPDQRDRRDIAVFGSRMRNPGLPEVQGDDNPSANVQILR